MRERDRRDDTTDGSAATIDSVPRARPPSQLPFAVIPLVKFTGDRGMMGRFVNPAWLTAAAWIISAVIIGLNTQLLSSVAGL